MARNTVEEEQVQVRLDIQSDRWKGRELTYRVY